MPKDVSKSKKGAKGKAVKVKKNPLFESRRKVFRVGRDIQPKRDLTRFVRWPKYILLQRQKRILYKRLKVPPAINQFTKTLDSSHAKTLFNLLGKYKAEAKTSKVARIKDEGKQKAQGKEKQKKKPFGLKYGLNHVTTLIEEKLARLVVIAHDVDPIEIVVWLPQLCRKLDVPFVFVKGKARLGAFCDKKTATCVALTDIKPEDNQTLESLIKVAREKFNNNNDLKRLYGEPVRGIKSQHRVDALNRAKEIEQIKKK